MSGLIQDEFDRKPLLMDVTLRDGSYLIDFRFRADQTSRIASALEGAGIRLIEVGHGIGLGASRSANVRAAETDEAYMLAASEVLKRAYWGVFCIPGIATLDDLRRAIDCGLSFVRIGTEVTEVARSGPFIDLARRNNVFVCANFMKSYATSPAEFAERALQSEGLGTQLIYIVDSAGGMMPEEMGRYFEAVKSKSKVRLGFHGHNNLGLAVANSLRAVELGAELIDASLRGMGRSSGNTPTETIALVLKRCGYDLGIDEMSLLDASESLIKPLMTHDPLNSIDIVSGYAQFHSSYMGIIREFSERYAVDPRHLIIELCKMDRINAPRDLLESLARKLSEEGPGVFLDRFRFDHYFGMEQNAERGSE